MRLIDADALIADLYDDEKHNAFMAPFKLCTADIIDLKFLLNVVPTIDAAPVVHGEWIYAEGFPCCNRCGASPAVCEPKTNNQSGFPMWCYGCGAKMDGGKDAEE